MLNNFRRLLRDERGQGLVEYALIITLVSVAAFAALSLMGHKTNNTLIGPAASAMPF
jgi:Flp pilus assembly pilin Flp